MNPVTDEQGKKPIKLSFYLVAFLDLLGQSDELLKITRLPRSAEEQQETLAVVTRTAGRVKVFRDAFDFLVTVGAPAKPELVRQMSPDMRRLFVKARSLQIKHRGVSDTFLITVPLLTNNEPEDVVRTANDVWLALLGIAGVTLMALAGGVPIRAGVDVGLGLDMFPDEVYGPVLVSAYNLESRTAEYPRTVIGQNLVDYLSTIAATAQNDPFTEFAVNKARMCQRLICDSIDDGIPMLHILSPEVASVAPKFAECRLPARDWVMTQVDRFMKESNEKLGDRYGRLAQYFERYI